jgi:hypothetical protein
VRQLAFEYYRKLSRKPPAWVSKKMQRELVALMAEAMVAVFKERRGKDDERASVDQ